MHIENISRFVEVHDVLFENFYSIIKVKVKVKVQTLDYNASLLDKPKRRSARVWHALSRDHTVLPAHSLVYPATCLPSRNE